MWWRNTIYGSNTIEGISIISGVLILFSFYNHYYLLSFLGALLLVLSRMSYYYLRNIGNELLFENEKETIRLTVGEETTLYFKLSQLSRLPIFHALMRVKFEAIIEGNGLSSSIDRDNIEFSIPIQIKGKGTIEIPVPIKALTRGVTRIKSLEITVPNFFGFGSVELKYNPYFQKELIIHPVPIAVPQTEQLVATKSQGDYPTPSSIYEQILAPIGTRDYVFSDSFQRIHWKASAKTQKLQTKVFERTSHYSWTFIINLREPNTPFYHMGVVENIESIASNVAYMAQLATKKGIEYEVFLNLRMASEVSVFHLPIGGGTHQLGKIFDMLSRIHSKGNTLTINKLLHFVEKQHQDSPVVIVCGPFAEEGSQYFAKMQRRGQRVYFLKDDVECPVIVPFVHS